jgi:diguanylate cyclase (GGDEF)-like protein
MISILAESLVISGALILMGALIPVRRLMARLPAGSARGRWCVMMGMIAVFIVGYLGYAALFWGRHAILLDLIVPGVFFLGGCFVWLTAVLSLQTAIDVQRVTLLEQENITDPLTGIFNRRYLERRLEEEVARARRYGLPLSVFMFDIDHFKRVNDSYGHQAGDQVLIAVGELAAKLIRETDIVARYGGEEFVVIASNTRLEAAEMLAARLREIVESHPFMLDAEGSRNQEIRLTVSIGIAALGDGIDSGEKLVHAADAALYRAKQEGRNRVALPPPAAQEER